MKLTLNDSVVYCFLFVPMSVQKKSYHYDHACRMVTALLANACGMQTVSLAGKCFPQEPHSFYTRVECILHAVGIRVEWWSLFWMNLMKIHQRGHRNFWSNLSIFFSQIGAYFESSNALQCFNFLLFFDFLWYFNFLWYFSFLYAFKFQTWRLHVRISVPLDHVASGMMAAYSLLFCENAPIHLRAVSSPLFQVSGHLSRLGWYTCK